MKQGTVVAVWSLNIYYQRTCIRVLTFFCLQQHDVGASNTPARPVSRSSTVLRSKPSNSAFARTISQNSITHIASVWHAWYYLQPDQSGNDHGGPPKNDATAAPSQREPASRLQQQQDIGASNTPSEPVKTVQRCPLAKTKWLGVCTDNITKWHCARISVGIMGDPYLCPITTYSRYPKTKFRVRAITPDSWLIS